MKKRYWTAFFLTAALGMGLHFLYELLPLPLVGLFAPVSESVWEHLKLLYWPFFLAALALSRRAENRQRAWSAFLASMLVQPLVLTAAYYLLAGGFGVHSLALDILLYYLVLGGGFHLASRLQRNGGAEPLLGLLIVLTAIYGVCLMVFTLASPQLPIFIEN